MRGRRVKETIEFSSQRNDDGAGLVHILIELINYYLSWYSPKSAITAAYPFDMYHIILDLSCSLDRLNFLCLMKRSILKRVIFGFTKHQKKTYWSLFNFCIFWKMSCCQTNLDRSTVLLVHNKMNSFFPLWEKYSRK